MFRARCKSTGDIVALKKLKMDKEKNGFPITSLREIQTLMTVPHENIVRVREVVVGDTLTQVFIVMDFVEHDLKTLLANMPTPFLASEIKTLMLQLLSAMAACHDNWIIHRDLKTSNLLMNNRGQIKVADFGLARTYGEPLGDMTQLVVTLWYRSVPPRLCNPPLEKERRLTLKTRKPQRPGTLVRSDRVLDRRRHLVHRLHLWRTHPPRTAPPRPWRNRPSQQGLSPLFV